MAKTQEELQRELPVPPSPRPFVPSLPACLPSLDMLLRFFLCMLSPFLQRSLCCHSAVCLYFPCCQTPCTTVSAVAAPNPLRVGGITWQRKAGETGSVPILNKRHASVLSSHASFSTTVRSITSRFTALNCTTHNATFLHSTLCFCSGSAVCVTRRCRPVFSEPCISKPSRRAVTVNICDCS